MKKWKPFRIIGGCPTNEPYGIVWVRSGVAALGESASVERIEFYDNFRMRDEAVFSGPEFAK